MAEISLTAEPILGGVDIQIGENRIRERDDLAIVSIAIPQGGDATLAKALQAGWSLDIPTSTQTTASGDTRAVRTAPDQLSLIFPHTTPDAETQVQARLNGAGYTTEQTDAWVVLEISGPETSAAMERLCPLDIARFETGDTGRTVMEHLGALIVKLDADRFLLMSASSSAQSFLHAVETSYRNVA